MPNSKPTLFSPVKFKSPIRYDLRTKNQSEIWQALFLPKSDAPSFDSPSDPIAYLYPAIYPSSKRRPKSVKRLSSDKTMANTHTHTVQDPTQTLRNYLIQHFYTQPVSVYTKAGRIQGKVETVTDNQLILETAEGTRTIDLHAIFSVAHILPGR